MSTIIRHFSGAALASIMFGCANESELVTNAPMPPSNNVVTGSPLATTEGMVRIKNRAYIYRPALWPTHTVYVCWEKPTSANATERGWVEDAVRNSWQKSSRLEFKGWGACATGAVGIRIAIRDDGSNDGPHTVGFGTQLNGVRDGMILNFTFTTWGQSCKDQGESHREACIRSIAVHEFGHAIGFAHEQNRPDTPGECTAKPQGPNGNDTDLTPWDIHSVMNYCNPVYNNDGQLSAYDKQALADVYGRPPQ